MSGTITHTHGADATPHTHGEMTAPSGKPTRVDALLGKETDEEWAGRLDNAVVDVLSLDQWEAQKSRLRRTTIGGRELAVSLDLFRKKAVERVVSADKDLLTVAEAEGLAVFDPENP